MSLSDIPLRAQTLAGQIKQADAEVEEAKLMRDRAEKALTEAEITLAKKENCATDLRRDRDELQREAAEHIAKLGEPEAAPEADPLTEAYQEAKAEIESAEPPGIEAVRPIGLREVCDHTDRVYRGYQDDYVCQQCGAVARAVDLEDGKPNWSMPLNNGIDQAFHDATHP